jgi:hypothetical protein
MPPETKLDTAAVFERVFSVYRRQARLLLPLAFAISVVPAVLSFGVGIWAQLAATLILAVWYQGAVVLAVRATDRGDPPLTPRALLRELSPAFAPLLWTGIVVAVGVFVGILFFVIPGLVVLTQWAVAAPVVVLERVGPAQALTRSRELVRGNGWQVFGVIVVTLVIVIVVDLVCGSLGRAISSSDASLALAGLVAGTLTAPLFALVSAVMYLSLRAGRP